MAQRVGRGIAVFFHDHGTKRGWGVSSTPRPYFNPRKTRYPSLVERQGRSGRAENLAPPGFDPRNVQPVVSHYTDWATRPTQTLPQFSLNIDVLWAVLTLNTLSTSKMVRLPSVYYPCALQQRDKRTYFQKKNHSWFLPRPTERSNRNSWASWNYEQNPRNIAKRSWWQLVICII